MSYYRVTYSDELYHHGIKGQKWGQRRFQNEDGSLTDAGRARYDVGEARRAAITGGLIGYAHYRKTHSGRDAAIAKYRDDKRKAKAAKQKALEKQEKAKMSVKGDKSVRIALDKDQKERGADSKGLRRYINMKRDERSLRQKGNQKYKMDELEAYAKAEKAWNAYGSKSKVDQARYTDAQKKVNKQISNTLINKYGSEAYDSMKKVDTAVSYAALAGMMSLSIAATITKRKSNS